MRPSTLGERYDAGEPVTELFERVVTLAERRGYIPIGFRTIALPNGFVVTVNGTTEARHDRTPEGEPGLLIRPFHVSVWWHGWPCGLFGMFEGSLLVGVEDPLLQALASAFEES